MIIYILIDIEQNLSFKKEQYQNAVKYLFKFFLNCYSLYILIINNESFIY